VPFTWVDGPARSLPVVTDCEALETANEGKDERTTRFERVPVQIGSLFLVAERVFMPAHARVLERFSLRRNVKGSSVRVSVLARSWKAQRRCPGLKSFIFAACLTT